ncbi:S8 family serine peptidase [Sulfurimonas sp.]|uniref:S8 family serine peptidase n=1 Tax=Sulfurimonas sp. TaxID=2022749 RepID=UPI003D0A0B53
MLCKRGDLKSSSANINVLTTIAYILYVHDKENNSSIDIEDYLNTFAKSVFTSSVDSISGVDYRDLFAYHPTVTSSSVFKNPDLYRALFDEGVMDGLLNNTDVDALLTSDSDNDTLTFWDEILVSSQIAITDTDNDGLSDDDEINIYGTSALDPDTDGDYIPDGVEVSEGSDPNDDDENNNNVLDGLDGDPYFAYQWYIQSLGTAVANIAGVRTILGNDLDILEVYHSVLGNNSGSKLLVQVVDSGVDANHEDLEVDLANSLNAVNASNDPTPTEDIDESDPTSSLDIGHGTAVAGIIGAKANNSYGIRGVAPRVKIAGSNWLEEQSLSELEKVWYSQINDDSIVVSNNSWGAYYSDDTAMEAILENGVNNLREGKGRIYIFAAGNERYEDGNANLSTLTNNPYAITVAALNYQDKYASYSNPGSSILVSAYGGEFYDESPTIMTTIVSGTSFTESELLGEYGAITIDTDSSKNYTFAMSGTSAATPMVSASIALVIDACPELTYRDIRWLIANTATQIDTTNFSWIENAAGHMFSIDYGYGKINSKAMIQQCKSRYFTSLPTLQQASVEKSMSIAIPDTKTAITKTITMSDSLTIEWVGLTIDTDHTYSGDLEINLTSPAGSKINIVTANRVSGDFYNGGFRFGSVGYIDENSKGTWTIEIIDQASDDSGTLNGIKLEVYGHED